MDSRKELGEFLASRRARITPEQAGLTSYGTNRRVPGLRRQEVAVLAGLSVEYLTRLERGSTSGVSDIVLDALRRALHLDDAESSHLFDLARTARSDKSPRKPARSSVRPSIQRVLDSMTEAPALVVSGRLDVLATNALGHALYSPALDGGQRPANLALFAFFDPRARDFYPEWETVVDGAVALLRTEAGRDPSNRSLSQLIGELATRSDEFRVRWGRHDVRLHQQGSKRFTHPVVGDILLFFDALELPAERGQTLTVYTAEPDTPATEKLRVLASWAATTHPPAPAAATESR
ncbi:helix-turn-helix transcriptional regulator [Angustibacter speluncae]